MQIENGRRGVRERERRGGRVDECEGKVEE